MSDDDDLDDVEVAALFVGFERTLLVIVVIWLVVVAVVVGWIIFESGLPTGPRDKNALRAVHLRLYGALK